MQWYHYFGGFWAGMFLANFVPHFIKGISGDHFPTPFAKPPGKGLSSPLVNVLWALLNLVAGYLLFRFAKISADDNLSVLICFIGFTCISIMGAKNFVHKDKL
ncbi:MAG: hypothetical protein JWQ57_4784 [Mucilaginibacter sp.]|nr:hypothetical protein [Mucilaginibacter sp.]